MKLGKMQFAHVLAHCISNGMSAGEFEVEELDRRIEFVVPEPAKASEADVQELMRQMNNPDGFIPAIKAYRVLTGAGLREAKEAVEKFRNVKAA